MFDLVNTLIGTSFFDPSEWPPAMFQGCSLCPLAGITNFLYFKAHKSNLVTQKLSNIVTETCINQKKNNQIHTTKDWSTILWKQTQWVSANSAIFRLVLLLHCRAEDQYSKCKVHSREWFWLQTAPLQRKLQPTPSILCWKLNHQ